MELAVASANVICVGLKVPASGQNEGAAAAGGGGGGGDDDPPQPENEAVTSKRVSLTQSDRVRIGPPGFDLRFYSRLLSDSFGLRGYNQPMFCGGV